MQRFSKRLIALRKERGITQEELAKVIHKKRSTVSGYETEGKEPDLETICLMAQYFGVSSDYLLGMTDHRTHTETVFFNDNVNFKKHFESLSPDLRTIVSQTFDNFYLLLSRDIQLSRPERLLLYRKLFQTIQFLREEVRKHIEAFGGAVNDAAALSELMSLQSELKNNVSAVLDELIQADMEVAFDVKKKGSSGLSSRLVT